MFTITSAVSVYHPVEFKWDKLVINNNYVTFVDIVSSEPMSLNPLNTMSIYIYVCWVKNHFVDEHYSFVTWQAPGQYKRPPTTDMNSAWFSSL